jgi:hypothetical protein
LPPYAFTSMKFLLAYAKGDKKLLKDREIIKTEVYRFKEFSFDKIMDMIKTNGQVRTYIPEEWFTSKRGNRDYLWLVLASLRFEFVRQI